MFPAIYITQEEAVKLRAGDKALRNQLDTMINEMDRAGDGGMLITKDEDGMLTDFVLDDDLTDRVGEFDDEPATIREPPSSNVKVWTVIL